mmetsp:Transcript_8215/g.26999  ORF Transcript_8215/g.26999 Transcript_8215/m.26999 type:complete len:206 (-) Transcript_8215:43-660(-)
MLRKTICLQAHPATSSLHAVARHDHPHGGDPGQHRPPRHVVVEVGRVLLHRTARHPLLLRLLRRKLLLELRVERGSLVRHLESLAVHVVGRILVDCLLKAHGRLLEVLIGLGGLGVEEALGGERIPQAPERIVLLGVDLEGGLELHDGLINHSDGLRALAKVSQLQEGAAPPRKGLRISRVVPPVDLCLLPSGLEEAETLQLLPG